MYLFQVWDCNDQIRMKVVRTLKEGCATEEEVNKTANWLLDKTKVEKTGWVEIWQFWGAASK